MINYLKLYTDTFIHAEYNSSDSLSYSFLSSSVKHLKDTDNEVKSILDIGSGRGNVITTLLEHFPMNIITSADLKKFHDYTCNFIELDLSKDFNLAKYDLITCLDVMEHLEENLVDRVFKSISEASKFQVFSIANHKDAPYEIDLHLTIQDCDWWTNKLEKYFEIIDVKSIYDCLYGFVSKTKV